MDEVKTMPDKKAVPQSNSVLGTLSGKTLNNLQVYIHGSVEVVELGFSDGTTQFIKFKNFQVEIGGTNEWDTGTKK